MADGTPATLLADPARVRQILLNLLSHALEWADPGEVWLAAEPGRDATEAVLLTVKDAGPTLAPELRDRLFMMPDQWLTPDAAEPLPTLSVCGRLGRPDGRSNRL